MDGKRVYTLFSSSDGNCVYFANGKNEYLIDCGVSARSCETALNSLGSSLTNIKAVFVTHEHTDHIRGLEMICKHFELPVYAPVASFGGIAACAPHAVRFLTPLEPETVIGLEGISVTPFATPHDSAASCGFRVEMDGVSFGVATDMGYVTKNTARALCGCGAVIIESNHDIEMLKNGDYPQNVKQRILGNHGHLSNDACAAFVPYLAQTGTNSLVLAHLSPRNNTPRAAFSASYNALAESGAKVAAGFGEGDVRLAVAPACGICKAL